MFMRVANQHFHTLIGISSRGNSSKRSREQPLIGINMSLLHAHETFYLALADILTKGSCVAMEDIWSKSPEVTVTNSGPFNARQMGRGAVIDEFRRQADLKLGGEVTITELLVSESESMAYTSHVET